MSRPRALGDALIYQRTIKGYSQQELSEKSQVTVRTIQRIEKGKTDPHLQTVKLLANALEIEISDLLYVDNPRHEDIQKKWLLLLHATPFIAFVVPLANIFVPLFIWIHKRDDNPLYGEHGRKILNFQFTMSLLFVLSVVLLYFDNPVGGLPAMTFLLGVMVYFVVVTGLNIFTAVRHKKAYYPLSIPFIPRKRKADPKLTVFF